MTRMLPTLCLLLLTVSPADLQAAREDRAQFPVVEHGYCYYLSTSHLTGEERAKTEAALAFTVAWSSSQPLVEKCVPTPVADGLYRIRLDDLKWDWRQWHQVLATYPYDHKHPPLVVRADWLILQLADDTESDAHYRLLYGREQINRDDFLKFWGVNNEQQAAFGLIIKSDKPNGPAVAGLRWIENRPTNNRGSAWGTRDSAKITKDSDPLEKPDGSFKHDAEEWLVSQPKQSITTGERGFLLASLLNNARGVKQNEAPANIVTDHHGFRGQYAIRNRGSCVSCHAAGIIPPGVSELRTYIADGVDLYATPKKLQEQLELFHFSDAGKQLERDNEDFNTATRLVNGLDGPTNAECFTAALASYDAEVTLERAAAELYTKPEELRLALAYASAGVKLGARLAGLAHGKPLPRTAWEEHYLTAAEALYAWSLETQLREPK